MWGSTLRKIRIETAEQAALKWCDGIDDLRLISNSINCVYYFKSKGNGYFIRITHEKIRSVKEVSAALDYLLCLEQAGVPVCKPVESLSDQLIETVEQDELKFIAHICAEVPGVEMHFSYNDLNVYAVWGEALAKLHLAAMDYQPAPNIEFLTWQDIQQETDNYIQHEIPQVQAVYSIIQDWLASQSITKDNYGLVHDDMRVGNVLCDGQRIHFIDFDEPVYHWWMQDVARAFLEVSSKDIEVWGSQFKHFIAGYRRVKPLTTEQLQQVPWLIKNKTIEIYLWTKNNWDDPIAPGGGSTERWLTEMYQNILDWA